MIIWTLWWEFLYWEKERFYIEIALMIQCVNEVG